MSLRRRHSKDVRWGHLNELDKRFRVGSAGFDTYPLRLKHLHSWRQMHAVAPGHMPVRMYGTRLRVRPSSDLALRLKAAFCLKRS